MSISSLILFLFCIMLLDYKLSNMSLSVTFCFLIFRRLWVSLEMSKIQKRFIFGQNLHVMEVLDFMKYLMDSKHNNLQVTQQLFMYRIISKHDNQSWTSLLSSCTVTSNSAPSLLHETNLHKSVYINWFLMHLYLIVTLWDMLVLQPHKLNSINSKETGNSYVLNDT